MDILTDDMVERIIVAGGQETALQYMFLNTRYYDIATRPACWKTMHVKNPGIGSFCFMAKTATKCESLCIDSARPVDAAWFVHGMAMHLKAGRNSLLRRLDIDINAEHEDVPNNLVASALGFKGLHDLRIAITYPESIHTPTHFFVPRCSAALPTLSSFKFYDQSGDLPGALAVIFGGAQLEMTRLHTLKVRGPYTDFFDLARAGTMPALRAIMYFTNELPLNMIIPSPNIRVFEIRVHTGHEARRFFKVLEHVASIDTLVLHDERLMPVFRCNAKIRRIFIYVETRTEANMTVSIDTERLSGAVEEINIFGPRSMPWHVVAPIQPGRKKVPIHVCRSL